jgi:hypothetical protein
MLRLVRLPSGKLRSGQTGSSNSRVRLCRCQIRIGISKAESSKTRFKLDGGQVRPESILTAVKLG